MLEELGGGGAHQYACVHNYHLHYFFCLFVFGVCTTKKNSETMTCAPACVYFNVDVCAGLSCERCYNTEFQNTHLKQNRNATYTCTYFCSWGNFTRVISLRKVGEIYGHPKKLFTFLVVHAPPVMVFRFPFLFVSF